MYEVRIYVWSNLYSLYAVLDLDIFTLEEFLRSISMVHQREYPPCLNHPLNSPLVTY